LSVCGKSIVPDDWSAAMSCTIDVVPVDHLFLEVGWGAADDGASRGGGARRVGGCRGGGGGGGGGCR